MHKEKLNSQRMHNKERQMCLKLTKIQFKQRKIDLCRRSSIFFFILSCFIYLFFWSFTSSGRSRLIFREKMSVKKVVVWLLKVSLKKKTASVIITLNFALNIVSISALRHSHVIFRACFVRVYIKFGPTPRSVTYNQAGISL